MKIKQEFFGFSPVMWMGVVEDINDPIKLGRVKVRIFGWHTQSTGGGQPLVPGQDGGAAGAGGGNNSATGEAGVNDTEYARAYFFNFGIDVNDPSTYPPNQVAPADRSSRGFPVVGEGMEFLLERPPMSELPEYASGKGKGGSGGGGGGTAPFGEGGGSGSNGEDVPVGDLPWAHVMQSATLAPNSGTGGPMTGMQQGTWVMGMFLDGEIGREPIVMGSMPGIPMELSKGPQEGFYDPEAVWPRETESWKIEEPDTNRLARNDNTQVHGDPKDYKHNVIDRKINDSMSTVLGDDLTFDEPVLFGWEEFKAKYPHNKVLETPCGHIFEVDDTPEFERIHIYHKNGSYIEMGGACGAGNRIDKISGDWYTLVKRNFVQAVHGNVDVAGVHVTFTTKTFVATGQLAKIDAAQIHLTGKVIAGSVQVRNGWTGSFEDINGKVIQVIDGIVVGAKGGS